MSVLENLLRRRRRQCEEQRRYLAELELLAERLRADARRLRAEIEREAVLGNPVSARPRPSSLARQLPRELPGELIERRGTLERSVFEVEGRIAEAGAALGAAEQELKRHELASAQHAGSAALSDRRRARRLRRARPVAPPMASPDRGD